jgi:hypothetical protein
VKTYSIDYSKILVQPGAFIYAHYSRHESRTARMGSDYKALAVSLLQHPSIASAVDEK